MAILTARNAADLMRPAIAGATRERLAIAYLDRDGHLLDLLLRDDAGDHVVLPIREIVGRALALNAFGLVAAHNHPSGDPSPSVADIAATRRLALTCGAVDIRLHDHLIFAGERCVSFRLEGLL
ncbi:MAG: JAB domain-containing protein [Sphingomonas sp.]